VTVQLETDPAARRAAWMRLVAAAACLAFPVLMTAFYWATAL